MKAIKFEGCNREFAKDQPQYITLYAWEEEGGDGCVVTKWKYSFSERIKILFGANMWVTFLMFGKPLTPSKFSLKQSDHVIFTPALIKQPRKRRTFFSKWV